MKKISQRDIAKTLGVNVSSVSRALKGQKGVSEELRQKIARYHAHAQPLGYVAGGFCAQAPVSGIQHPDSAKHSVRSSSNFFT